MIINLIWDVTSSVRENKPFWVEWVRLVNPSHEDESYTNHGGGLTFGKPWTSRRVPRSKQPMLRCVTKLFSRKDAFCNYKKISKSRQTPGPTSFIHPEANISPCAPVGYDNARFIISVQDSECVKWLFIFSNYIQNKISQYKFFLVLSSQRKNLGTQYCFPKLFFSTQNDKLHIKWNEDTRGSLFRFALLSQAKTTDTPIKYHENCQ